MRFYRLVGFPASEKWNEENEDERERHRKARTILRKTNSFNQCLQNKDMMFLVNTSEDSIEIGMIIQNCTDVSDLLSEYMKKIEIELKDPSFEEVTFKTFCNMLRSSDRNGYIYDSDEVLEQFDLDKLSGGFGRRLLFEEKILADRNRVSAYKDAEKFLATEALIPELDRIYAGGAKQKAVGHPVHYMIQTDDKEACEGICRVLLQSLYANNRLLNKRYSSLDVEPGENFSRTAYDSLYKSNSGGTVILKYLANDDAENNYADCGSDTIKELCNVMKKYKNLVLTVVCLPRECTKSQDLFYENLGNISIVELKEEFVSGERAKRFLRGLAKDNEIRTDKQLFEKLEEDRSYLAPDLRRIFDGWYNNKLKTSVYPQYKNIETVEDEVIKTVPKGSAYNELDQMIGLDEAKKVINQALNYRKAQKLFAEKGMKNDHPSMHMVFTGNPGTAKTTVARLFARIMKENNLLSKGYLIEVGRGDLVGKFVGWTAPTIQAKFKEAQGSVLFIDEAYSLVDDRNGSFGDEAINTIVQEMENHRDDVVVIFAGYPRKMEQFLQKNPGLRSRIAYHVPFEDYDTESLCEIAKLIAKQKGLEFTDEACDKLTSLFDIAKKENDFGNGRYARNVVEKAKIAQATRLLTMDLDTISSKDVARITADDIEFPQACKKQEKKRIGFALDDS